ncbi:MAG: dienelactone hydrolase family protein [Flavobacteriales bacterium]|nr:dienelactone hydrolase family protein [Flavobacteriales bacterium]
MVNLNIRIAFLGLFILIKGYSQFFPEGKAYENVNHQDFGFEEISININAEKNIKAYLMEARTSSKPKSLLVYIQGSGANPIVDYSIDEKGKHEGCYIPFIINTKSIPDNFDFLVLSKTGIPFIIDRAKFTVPELYHKYASLNERVADYDVILKYLINQKKVSYSKVIALGHSEGSDVVAKLGSINKLITHVGYWSGGGASQFYDFLLFEQRNAAQSDDSTTLNNIQQLYDQIDTILSDPNSTEKQWSGHAHRRWSSFSEPPIENLLKIDCPIFMAMGMQDRSVPVESAYLIPVEFKRQNKKNLSYKFYPNLSHSFNSTDSEGITKSHWFEVFKDFLLWVDEN